MVVLSRVTYLVLNFLYYIFSIIHHARHDSEEAAQETVHGAVATATTTAQRGSSGT